MMSGLVVRPEEKLLFYGIYFVGKVANRCRHAVRLRP